MNTLKKDDMNPIKRQSVSEQVAQQLIGLIQSGDLKPGQQLPPERELTTMLDVSRPSLREALRALSLLGLVNIRQGGGVFVSALDPESLLGPLHFFISLNDHNIESLFEARAAIESTLVRLAAIRITDAQLDFLKNLVEDEDELLSDPQKFMDVDEQFHRTIFDVVENSFLIRVATSLHILVRASRRITGYIPGVLKKSIKDHQRILAALEQRDPAKASEAMERHLVNVRTAYEKQQKANQKK